MRVSSLIELLAASTVLTAAGSTALFAEERIEMRWKQLGEAVTGKQVWIPLAGGAKVSGIVQSVEPEGLRLEILKTSDRKNYPKGLTSVPRASISTISLRKPAGHKGIIIGGIVGGAIGATAGGTLGAIRRNEGGTGGEVIIAAAAIGPLAIGLAAGYIFDTIARHRTQRIVVTGD